VTTPPVVLVLQCELSAARVAAVPCVGHGLMLLFAAVDSTSSIVVLSCRVSAWMRRTCLARDSLGSAGRRQRRWLGIDRTNHITTCCETRWCDGVLRDRRNRLALSYGSSSLSTASW
jgi:hypothetical protein